MWYSRKIESSCEQFNLFSKCLCPKYIKFYFQNWGNVKKDKNGRRWTTFGFNNKKNVRIDFAWIELFSKLKIVYVCPFLSFPLFPKFWKLNFMWFDSLFLCGDFNSHSPLWGSGFFNYQGRELCSVVLDRGLIPLNDSLPTILPVPGRSAGNLDLVFYSAARFGTASVRVTGDTHGSDHFLLVGHLSVSLLHSRPSSNRLNTKTHQNTSLV